LVTEKGDTRENGIVRKKATKWVHEDEEIAYLSSSSSMLLIKLIIPANDMNNVTNE
jgi:hypothetical protein